MRVTNSLRSEWQARVYGWIWFGQREEQATDVDNEMTLVPEHQVYDSKTGIEIPREKVLAGRKAEMEEMMNAHFFDEVPESEAAGKKLVRAKWLKDDRAGKAREGLVAMEIAACEGKRDDKHAMTPPLKLVRMLVSRGQLDRRLDDTS